MQTKHLPTTAIAAFLLAVTPLLTRSALVLFSNCDLECQNQGRIGEYLTGSWIILWFFGLLLGIIALLDLRLNREKMRSRTLGVLMACSAIVTGIFLLYCLIYDILLAYNIPLWT